MTFGELVGTVSREDQTVEIRGKDNQLLCVMPIKSRAIKCFADMTVSSWYPGTRGAPLGDIVVLLKDE